MLEEMLLLLLGEREGGESKAIASKTVKKAREVKDATYNAFMYAIFFFKYKNSLQIFKCTMNFKPNPVSS